jgi:hypothetical protein
MKLICTGLMALLMLQSNVFANNIKLNVVGTEAEVTRNAADIKKIDVDFQFKRKKVWYENYCINWRLVRRVYPCRRPGPRPRPRPGYCYYTERVCMHWESRRYERMVSENIGTRLKFTKSARQDYRGPEQYFLKFDKNSMCLNVEAINQAAQRREISQGCRKAKIK